MRASLKIIGLIYLLLVASGCSTYKVVSWVPPTDERIPAAIWIPDAKSGDQVRVTLGNGSRYAGRLVSLSVDEVILQPDRSTRDRMIRRSESGPSGAAVRAQRNGSVVIARNQVLNVEKRVGSGGRTGLLVFGIIIGTVGVLAVAIAANGGIMGQ